MRYWRPWRKLMLKLCLIAPDWLADRIADYLYPDDTVLHFGPWL